MLNYRTTFVGFMIALSWILLAVVFLKITLWWVLPAIFVFMGLTGWGSYKVDSGFYLKTICKGENKKQISITFDDGPNAQVTPKLLDLLKSFNVKATFFLIGKRIPGNESILWRMKEEGHLIGNHTHSHHGFLPFYPWRKLKTDLDLVQTSIEKITGIKTSIFRPPFGVTSPPYAKAIKALGLQSIGWSNRSLDTMEKDPYKIFERVNKQLQDGDIILFHDTDEKILIVVEKLLNNLAENGIKVVPLDELIKIEPYVKS